MSREIFVYGGWESLGKDIMIGTLRADVLRGKEVFSFEYDNDWLNSHANCVLDPDLQFYKGRQYTHDDKTLFGVFTDSCPDRWGRILMKRREALSATDEGRPVRTLLESDYLLGIHDQARMGALRFKTRIDGPFLDTDSGHPIPVWTSIRELEHAAVNIDSETGDEKTERDWIRILVQPGSSLGGARPKATVQDTEGRLWIAKFPSRKDEFNTGAWEMVIHQLALKCHIDVPEARCGLYSETGSTFMARRFDRTSKNGRLHYLSAMTVLGRTDGQNAAEGSGYLDIASAIKEYGSKPREDLLELWKRIVFSIAVNNTDDHLRNHGFLFDSKGLRLSPMFDVNPNPDGTALSLNIDDSSNAMDFDLAISVAPFFDISRDVASATVSEIKENIASWSYIARGLGIGNSEISMMGKCFKSKFH